MDCSAALDLSTQSLSYWFDLLYKAAIHVAHSSSSAHSQLESFLCKLVAADKPYALCNYILHIIYSSECNPQYNDNSAKNIVIFYVASILRSAICRDSYYLPKQEKFNWLTKILQFLTNHCKLLQSHSINQLLHLFSFLCKRNWLENPIDYTKFILTELHELTHNPNSQCQLLALQLCNSLLAEFNVSSSKVSSINLSLAAHIKIHSSFEAELLMPLFITNINYIQTIMSNASNASNVAQLVEMSLSALRSVLTWDFSVSNNEADVAINLITNLYDDTDIINDKLTQPTENWQAVLIKSPLTQLLCAVNRQLANPRLLASLFSLLTQFATLKGSVFNHDGQFDQSLYLDYFGKLFSAVDEIVKNSQISVESLLQLADFYHSAIINLGAPNLLKLSNAQQILQNLADYTCKVMAMDEEEGEGSLELFLASWASLVSSAPNNPIIQKQLALQYTNNIVLLYIEKQLRESAGGEAEADDKTLYEADEVDRMNESISPLLVSCAHIARLDSIYSIQLCNKYIESRIGGLKELLLRCSNLSSVQEEIFILFQFLINILTDGQAMIPPSILSTCAEQGCGFIQAAFNSFLLYTEVEVKLLTSKDKNTILSTVSPLLTDSINCCWSRLFSSYLYPNTSLYLHFPSNLYNLLGTGSSYNKEIITQLTNRLALFTCTCYEETVIISSTISLLNLLAKNTEIRAVMIESSGYTHLTQLFDHCLNCNPYHTKQSNLFSHLSSNLISTYITLLINTNKHADELIERMKKLLDLLLNGSAFQQCYKQASIVQWIINCIAMMRGIAASNYTSQLSYHFVSSCYEVLLGLMKLYGGDEIGRNIIQELLHYFLTVAQLQLPHFDVHQSRHYFQAVLQLIKLYSKTKKMMKGQLEESRCLAEGNTIEDLLTLLNIIQCMTSKDIKDYSSESVGFAGEAALYCVALLTPQLIHNSSLLNNSSQLTQLYFSIVNDVVTTYPKHFLTQLDDTLITNIYLIVEQGLINHKTPIIKQALSVLKALANYHFANRNQTKFIQQVNRYQSALLQLLLFNYIATEILTDYSAALLPLLVSSPHNYVLNCKSIIQQYVKNNQNNSNASIVSSLEEGLKGLVAGIQHLQPDSIISRGEKLAFHNKLRVFLQTVRTLLQYK
jgi:hypothetical protein